MTIGAVCGARRRTGHPPRQHISSRRVTAFISSMLVDGAIMYGDLILQTPNQATHGNAEQKRPNA
jgi:hypothetical protein